MKNIIAATLILYSSIAVAHEDRIIQIGKNGDLSGLPAKYSPSTLINHYRIDGSGQRRLNSIELTISGKKTIIPTCVAAMVNSTRSEEISAVSSWYHDTSRLPPYIDVTYLNPGFDPASYFNSGYSFMFNLDTGRLIGIKALVAGSDKHSIQEIPVDLGQLCPADAIKLFYSPRK